MFRSLFRVLFGFVIAAIVAGAVMVGFSGGFSRGMAMADAAELVLLTATHSALFAAAFALIAIGISEWQRIRAWIYHAFAGVVISMLGFVAQGSSEIGSQGTIFNSYAGVAYLAAGLLGGLAYWLFAGSAAGGRRGADSEDDDVTFAPEDTSSMQARLPPPEKSRSGHASSKGRLATATDPTG